MESDARIAVPTTALDADPWLLNTPSGVVDLRTGLLRPHDPALLLTKMTRVSVDRENDCGRWKTFLQQATGGNLDLVAYLQRLAGYCLTGATDEHAVVFVYGPGGNGKSVCLNTLNHILGDYAATAPMSTFVASRHDRHPTEVAMLHGARLVTASETSEGGRWNEERLKSLSGGDPVTARFLFHDFFTFQPQFKLLLVGNRKPSLDTVDEAMRRRLQLVPFTVKPQEPDPYLTEKLRAEAPSILAWMVDGALAWQAQRLSPPELVRTATNEYFEDQDVIGRWLADDGELSAQAWTFTQHLYWGWKEWCGDRGEDAGSLKRLSQRLADRGFQRRRDGKTGRWGFVGIRLCKEPMLAAFERGAI
jgi:putative DNA primase/helicase